MQRKITRPSKLLNKQGELVQKGYATYPILDYNRREAAKKHRLKEWDYYLIYNREYAVGLTVGKSLNLLLISVSMMDLVNKKEITKTTLKTVPGSFHMPRTSVKGDILYQDRHLQVSFRIENNIRLLLLKNSKNANSSDLDLSLVLYNEPKDSMVIATPFKDNDKAFYYNRKIIGMRASGYVRYKDQTYMFSPVSSFGLLDWGRGIWPYKTTWYWSAAQGILHGRVFGFNLGHGFGDTSAATENMLFFNGKASKLRQVTFHIPRNDKNEYDYTKPWTITSSDQRIELVFVPILDRNVKLSILVLSTNQHQVFGKFSGRAILDDGSVIYLKDFLGFAERVQNRW